MSHRQKLIDTIEKLSRLTVKRGATPPEARMALEKIKVLRSRLEALGGPMTGPMTGPGVDWWTKRDPEVLTPERMARMAHNMKEWEDFLDSMYRRQGVPRPKPPTR